MIKTDKYKKLSYAIRFPDDYKAGERYPILFYIHGAGGRGTDINVMTKYNLMRKFEAENENRFILVAPQCYADTWFEIFEQLLDFVDFIRTSDFADSDRIYLSGSSMGGYTSWQLAMTKPEWFAALVPVCGGGMYWNAARLKTVPVWAFHGMKDPCVFISESINMVNAVNRCGGNAKFTAFENAEHNSWDGAFSTDELYDWLLSQHK